MPKKDPCKPSAGEAASNQPRDQLPLKSQSLDKLPSKSSLQPQSSRGGEDTGWPIFFDGEKLLQTTFKEDLWQCPFCDHWTNRIRQHLQTHKDKIADWTAADNFCNEVTAMKRRRTMAKADAKRVIWLIN